MISLRSRRKLKPSDARHFCGHGSELFAELAAVVCSTGVIPQKELHECWQMAEIVHAEFPDSLRIADLAAGHGLLAWILVLLARVSPSPLARTAITLDIRRPPSANRLSDAMVKRWPDLADTVHYVEGRVEYVISTEGSATLFVAAHACGSLSDYVLLAAARSNNPLAVMPCCLSVRKQGASLAALSATAAVPTFASESITDIDSFRITALQSLGYSTRDAYIQSEVTTYNRIIIARPAPSCRSGLAIPPDARAINVDTASGSRALSTQQRTWRRAVDISCWVPDAPTGEQWLDVLSSALAAPPQLSLSISIADRYAEPSTSRLAFTYRLDLCSTKGAVSKTDALNLLQCTRRELSLRGGSLRV